MTDLGTPGGTSGQAVDVNARGQVLLGGSNGSIGIWERGTIRVLPRPSGARGCAPAAINPGGQIIGGCDFGPTFRSYLWDQHGLTDLGTLGGSLTAAVAISPSGKVVGIGRGDPDEGSRPFLWERGTIIDLSTRGAPTGFIPYGVNAGGRIAGHYGVGFLRAIVWQRGRVIVLGGSPGEDAFDINARGQVVGQTVTGTGTHAVLWTPR